MNTESPELQIPGADAALVVDVTWDLPGGGAGLVVLLEDRSGRPRDQKDVVLPNQSVAPDRSVVLRTTEGEHGPDARRAHVQMDLSHLDPAIHRLELVLAALEPNTTLSAMGTVVTEVWDPSNGKDHARLESPPPGLSKCYLLATLDRGVEAWTYQRVDRPLDSEVYVLVTARASGVTDIS